MNWQRIAKPKLIGLSSLLLALFALSSCSTVPAKIRVFQPEQIRKASLASLLNRSISDPDPVTSGQKLAEFVAAWANQTDRSANGMISDGPLAFQVTFTGQYGELQLPEYFDEITAAHLVRIKKLERYTRSGVGGPLLAVRDNRHTEPIETYYPDEAITRPVTAVITEIAPISNGTQQVTIELLCPLCSETVELNGKTEILAADFSVSWAALLSRSKKLQSTALGDALRTNPRRDPQLYLMQPYDPRKEPLIMIHGLIDTPLVWAELSNDLWADPAIRQRYQIWHYLYNTSAPALYPGRLLRTQLRELRPMIDPELDDPAMQSTTLLTHSMGGLVGRSLIVRPGNAFRDAAFTRPLDSMNLTPEDRKSLQEAFFWEPEQHVKRVIFAAVPHRGSDYADNPIGQLGRRLIKPPSDFSAFYERISSKNPGSFTEAYVALGRGELDSVSALSPRQPTLQILAGLPSSHPVKIHSIMGNRGKSGPLEESSDGVVSYMSSHLEFADSEKIIPSGHEVIRHEEGKIEILRILKLE